MIDFDRLQPLRLARGSHEPGSGKGCAMNVISYITGEEKITDFPACSDRSLAIMVQMINDHLADRRANGFLSPEDALAVVALGVRTIGTNLQDHPEYSRRKVEFRCSAEYRAATSKLNAARARRIARPQYPVSAEERERLLGLVNTAISKFREIYELPEEVSVEEGVIRERLGV